ncbi:RUN and FYVE domain-containing protein 4 isoform X6 [Ursus arctos]|uniref:RUN and FYVE domain-containing protein 4 isoform X6 n=1 Tax=Ursus arctos TaxID=9644 RepID=UPI002548B9D7|nr:RUN and FYVE domain-containing protein 4 isoform X6 [Ursus arctos]
MAEEGAVLTRNLQAAVLAVLQGYGGRQQPVTDASAELHRLCGCLELLLQFDQKEQKSFLRPRKDYWDFLCTALWRQRGSTEPARFIRAQDKLKTPLAKGRAFIRFCLAHGQLAESLQLCLLSPEFTREWYGPRSPLVCPELREGLLDSLYALNGVAFDLDLQWPDLDEAWPMFSESCRSSASRTQGRRPRKTKDSPKQVPLPNHTPSCLLSISVGPPRVSATRGDPTGVRPETPHTSPAGCLRDAPREDELAGLPRSQQHRQLPPFVEKNREDPRSLGPPQSMWEPAGEELQQAQEKGAPTTGICLENSPSCQGQRECADGAPKESLRHELRKTKEQAQHQEQLLKEQEGELRTLQEQLSRCWEERARLQAELERKQQEAERRDAVYEEELGGQRDLVRAVKMRVLELIQEKDDLWQKAQHLSSMAPGCCVDCSKIFGRLSRRYPCRLCGGLVCHACSVDYKKRERRCPPCSQKGDAQSN